MIDIKKPPRWIAIYTKSRHEKTVADKLNNKGFEVYLPTLKKRRNLRCFCDDVVTTRKANLSQQVGQAKAPRKPPRVLNEAQEANNEPKFYVNYDDFAIDALKTS